MLRRLLWSIPTLFVLSIVVFRFLAWTLASTLTANSGQEVSAAIFFNSSPTDARDLALDLMSRVARGDDTAPEAASHLARLGGAALPHVLPRLDELSPTERARVSAALLPVARRMGVGTEEDFHDPISASIFWSRFWQDREFDFRPVVVRRLVKRLTERSLSLRRDDVIELDTYALPELVKALGSVHTREDVARVRRLTDLLSHVTELSWRLPWHANVDEARRLVRTWRMWWLDHGDEYVSLDGLAKATASIIQTRYGRWLRGLPMGLGSMNDGRTVISALSEGFGPTLSLLGSGAFGGTLTGAIIGAAFVLRRRQALALAASLGALLLVYTPLLVMLETGPPGGLPLACLAMAGFGAGIAYLYQRVATQTRRAAPWWPRRPGGTRQALSVLRASAATSLALLGTCLPSLVLAAAILERAFALGGLCNLTVTAVRTGDVAWLMVVALLGAGSASLLQILADGLRSKTGYGRSMALTLAMLERSRG